METAREIRRKKKWTGMCVKEKRGERKERIIKTEMY